MPSSETFTLSLHDALPISMMKLYQSHGMSPLSPMLGCLPMLLPMPILFALYFVFQNTIEFRGVSFLWLPDISLRDPYYITPLDRKSTRLNSSHITISYAVFRDFHSFPTRRSSDLDDETLPIARDEPAEPDVGLSSDAVADADSVRAVFRVSEYDRIPGRVLPLAARHLAPRPVLHHAARSEEHTSELQSHHDLVCRLPRLSLFPYTTLFRSR